MARLQNPLGPQRFEELLKPHIPYLYRLAYRFTGTVEDAEDLVQDLLVKLYPKREELAAIDQLRPWLTRVLYRQFVDSWRERVSPLRMNVVDDTVPQDPAASAVHLVPSDDAGPEEQADRRRLQELLQRAIQCLGEEHRAVLVLHDVEGYRLLELESMLGVPLGTLKSRLHRARERLKVLLGMEPFLNPLRVSNRWGDNERDSDKLPERRRVHRRSTRRPT